MIFYIKVIAHTPMLFWDIEEGKRMLFNYNEAIKKYGSDYKLKNAILKKEIYKIEKGIYSDKKQNYTLYELLLKKYPNAVLVKDSAFHFISFLKDEPEKVHLGTARNALRIKDNRVQQHFYKNLNVQEVVEDEKNVDISFGEELDSYWEACNETIKISSNNIQKYITENGNEVRLFNLNALYFDLLRERNKYPREKLFELLNKFKNCNIVMRLECFYAEDVFRDIMDDNELYELIEEIKHDDFDKWLEQKYSNYF